MDAKEFARAIAERKISQRKLAKELGMNPTRLSDMLVGRLKGWKYRRRISQYLGIPEEILFPDDGNLNEQHSCQS